MKSTARILIAILTLAATAGVSVPARALEHPHYALDLEIHPAQQRLEVVGTLTLPAAAAADSLVLHLHRRLEIRHVRTDRPHELRIDPGASRIRYLPDARRIVLAFAEPSPEPVAIEFAYGGTITEWPGWSASVIGADWTEIGLYFPWYPYSLDRGVFTYELAVTSDPGYEPAAMGTIERRDDRWLISCPDPTNDIVVCLARDLRTHETDLGSGRLRIFHSGIPDDALAALSNDIAGITRRFDAWFGAVERDLCVVESRREKGGGYGRIGGVFLGGFDSAKFLAGREGYNRYLAHEISHQWWHRAPSANWEDWLNESFAEYSALLLIRERFGPETYARRLADKKESSAGTPPVHGCDRDGEAAQKVLYDKGPVLLGELEERIGRDGFRQLCADMFGEAASSTADFLDLLEQREGGPTREWFEEALKTR